MWRKKIFFQVRFCKRYLGKYLLPHWSIPLPRLPKGPDRNPRTEVPRCTGFVRNQYPSWLPILFQDRKIFRVSKSFREQFWKRKMRIARRKFIFLIHSHQRVLEDIIEHDGLHYSETKLKESNDSIHFEPFMQSNAYCFYDAIVFVLHRSDLEIRIECNL